MLPINNQFVEYKSSFEQELTNILSYWIKYSVDEKSNSFYGAADLDGKPVLTTNKSCVLNSRILWTFSAAAKKYDDPEYSRIADMAYEVLKRDFHLILQFYIQHQLNDNLLFYIHS